MMIRQHAMHAIRRGLGAMTLVAVVGCTHADEPARQLLLADGYTNIQLTGYSAFSCASSDEVATGFVGQKNGYHVTGTICGQWIGKDATIRVAASSPILQSRSVPDPYLVRADSILRDRAEVARRALADSLRTTARASVGRPLRSAPPIVTTAPGH